MTTAEHELRSRGRGFMWPVVLACVFALLVWPIIALPAARQGSADQEAVFPVAQMGDQIRWHEPVIRGFAADFPALDFSSYDSAIAPGYYAVMATFAQIADTRLALQLFSSLFGLLLVVSLWRVIALRVGSAAAAVLALPLAASSYVIATAIWLNTDNLALLLVLWTLAFLVIAQPTGKNLLIGIALAAATVFVRQVHLWVIAPGLLMIVAGAPVVPRWMPQRVLGESLEAPPWPATLGLAAAALAPFAVLGWLVSMWGRTDAAERAHRVAARRGHEPGRVPVCDRPDGAVRRVLRLERAMRSARLGSLRPRDVDRDRGGGHRVDRAADIIRSGCRPDSAASCGTRCACSIFSRSPIARS